jgi:hypothetical protein
MVLLIPNVVPRKRRKETHPVSGEAYNFRGPDTVARAISLSDRFFKNMRPNPRISSLAVIPLTLTLLTVASCSGNSDTAILRAARKTLAPRSKLRLLPPIALLLTPGPGDPAFDTLLPTRRQMTTAPIMLPTSLPSRVSGVATERDPNETPYTTDGDRYAILFLYSEPDPAK